jgi:hypothetical protein
MTEKPLEYKGSLQARMSENDPRLYNVNRDLAHCFVRVAELVAGRLEDGLWPELNEIVKREGLTQDDLGEACGAFCTFVATSVEDPSADMHTALERSGWFNVKPGAQVAAMACLGTVILGMHFSGVREATLGGEGPAMDLRQLAAFGERSSKLISMSRWQRRVARIKLRASNAWKAILGR